jgi:hypothetical protein
MRAIQLSGVAARIASGVNASSPAGRAPPQRFSTTHGRSARRWGLAALGTAAEHRTGHDSTPEALSAGYALGLSPAPPCWSPSAYQSVT